MSEQKTATTNSSVENNNLLFTKILSESYVKNRIDQIKHDDEYKNENDVKISDRRRTAILEIAEFIEQLFIQNGYTFFINQIAQYTAKIFEKLSLEKHIYLILEVLPDKYKDKNKDTYKTIRSKIYVNQIKRYVMDMMGISLSKISDPDMLRELKSLSLSFPDAVDKELLSRNLPLYDDSGVNEEYDELKNLKVIEDNKFKKASIGEPITTAEKLCEDPLYAKEFEELKKVMEQSIRAAEIMYDWFINKYPPLTVNYVIKLRNGYSVLNELMRPLCDRKYRRDHLQSANIAYTRALKTSTAASHASQIPCAHHLDKNGLPVMRGLTKEQIDSMYEWEINFMQKLVNTLIYWYEDISEVNAAHGGRCAEDRAVDLSDTLSHLS